MTIQHLYPTSRPTLDLNFARTKRLDPRVTFTRGSTATYADSDGLIKTAATDEARFDHDSATGENLGLLIEEARTNLQTYSEDFSQWTITVSNNTPGASISTNFATAPDGTTTADKFIPVNETFNYIRRGTITASNWSCTVYMKAAGMDYGTIAAGVSGSVRFNLANGTVVTETNATGQIQALANGWYRCTLVRPGSPSTPQFRIFPGDNSSNSQITTADGVKGILIWGAQAEDATFATSYIPTTSSTATRSADVASMTGTNFSSWYNQSEGTLSFATLSKGTAFAGYLQGASSTDRIEPYQSASYPQLVVVNSGTTIVNAASATSMSFSTKQQFAVGIKQGAYALAQQGAVTITGTSSTSPPTITQMFLGRQSTPLYLNGTIYRLAYYDRRLTDVQLQALSL